jgi:uncharacterized delta-60 repeat protein
MIKTKFILTIVLSWTMFGAIHANADYELDHNFGINGAVVYTDPSGVGYFRAVISNSSNNVFVGGVSGLDSGLFKYNSAGSLASGFPKTWDSSGPPGLMDAMSDIVADGSGNYYMSGFTATLDAALFKYNSSGTLAAGFPKTYDGGHSSQGYGDGGYGVGRDGDGNVYMVGFTENASGDTDGLLLKYDSAGNLAAGYPKTYDGGHNDYFFAVKTDENGNIFIAGRRGNATGTDAAFFKYDSSGNLVAGYPKTYDSGHEGYGYGDTNASLVLDGDGNTYLAGYTESAVPGVDFMLLKYDSSGSLAAGFPKIYNSGYESIYLGDEGNSIALDSKGNIFVGAISENSSGGADTILLKYNSAGSLAAGYPKTYSNQAAIVAGMYIDSYDNILLASSITPNWSSMRGVLLKYITEPDTPTSSVSGGTYDSAQSVSLTSTGDAQIYYTTDGSEPTTGSTLYSAPINISQSLTLKAKAFKNQLYSSTLSASYTISGNSGQNNNNNDNVNNDNDNNDNQNASSSYTPFVAAGNKHIFQLTENSLLSIKYKSFSFRGRVSDSSLINGKVVAYKDGKFLKRRRINHRGIWRLGDRNNLKERRTAHSYYFVYYNRNGNIVFTTPQYRVRTKNIARGS